ncbi:MAG: SDR family oxidoreductase [Pseudomonadota bacterium]
MTKGRLESRVAIITGAANGCGRAAVKMFLQEGAKVIGADIDAEAGKDLEQELGSPDFVFIEADVSKRAAVTGVAEATVERFGRIDILFNQAGTIIVKPFLEISDDDYDFILDNNARSVFLMTQAVLPEMLKQGKGAIVTTSSVSASTATPMEAVYCSSKAAVLQLTRAVAVEFRDQGVRANVICPGFIKTRHGILEMSQLRKFGFPATEDDIKAMQGRICEPEEVAGVAVFLASDESSFINGAELAVDNTFTAI